MATKSNGHTNVHFPITEIRSIANVAIGCFAALAFGCDNPDVRSTVGALKRPQSFHQKHDWRAEKYFQDADVVDLCNAIESKDLRRMDQLIVTGTNVNAVGKDGMTPLMWAFPDNNLKRFTKLLEAGADPNVLIESELDAPGVFREGLSVTHLSAETRLPGYFDAVMKHSGDVTLENWNSETIVHLIIKSGLPDAQHRLELAVQHGADLNAYDGSGIPPAILAAASFAQYDLALQILKLGADPKRTRRDTLFTLAHALAISSERLELMLPSERAAYNKLVQFLQGQGIDTELAKEDSKRWSTWGRTLSIPESKRRMDAEMAKVKRENAAALPQRMTE